MLGVLSMIIDSASASTLASTVLMLTATTLLSSMALSALRLRLKLTELSSSELLELVKLL